MIIGAHAIIYSRDPEADRAFIRAVTRTDPRTDPWPGTPLLASGYAPEDDHQTTSGPVARQRREPLVIRWLRRGRREVRGGLPDLRAR